MKLSFLIGLLFISFSTIPFSPCNADDGIAVVSMDVADRPLGQVVRQIASQTGYDIVIFENWKKVQISGKFDNIPIEEFFRRALKGRNVFLTVDERQKKITVQATDYSSPGKSTNDKGKGFLSEDQLEVTPGIRRKDVVDGPAYGPDVDPMDLEVTPGIRHRDVIKGTIERLVGHNDIVNPMLPPVQEHSASR